MTSEGETIRLVLHWQGGDHTQTDLEKFGRPVNFYTDKASHFQTAEKRKRDEPGVEKDVMEMPPTQIGRALRELGITWIAAWRETSGPHRTVW